MPQSLESDDSMIFSHIVSLGDVNGPKTKNTSSSIVIDVLLMLLCEQIGNHQLLPEPDLSSD